jgi:hypothetical protein
LALEIVIVDSDSSSVDVIIVLEDGILLDTSDVSTVEEEDGFSDSVDRVVLSSRVERPVDV